MEHLAVMQSSSFLCQKRLKAKTGSLCRICPVTCAQQVWENGNERELSCNSQIAKARGSS